MIKRFALIVAAGLALAACTPTTNQIQSAQTERMVSEGNQQVGMPSVHNWRERRMMKMLYELRDKEVATYSYVKNMDGSLSFLCNSVGYGLPYATQFTNPHAYEYGGGTYRQVDQPEPNGLFMPSHAEASWVMCVDQSDRSVKPVYVEERTIVSPFPMKASISYQSEPAPAPKAVSIH